MNYSEEYEELIDNADSAIHAVVDYNGVTCDEKIAALDQLRRKCMAMIRALKS